MHYLVTGGAGFIGSHLVEALLAAGHQVTVLDNLSSGKIENLAAVKELVEFIEGDINDQNLLKKILPGKDGIFHYAALASVNCSFENPQLNFETNIKGTATVFQAALENRIQKAVFASSASVYDSQKETAVTETSELAPQSPYAYSKLIGEQICRMYYNCFDMDVSILRFFNVYGSRQSPDSQYSGVVTCFIKQMLQGSPIMIHGDGHQSRDFIHVQDIVSASLLASRRGTSGVYNVAFGESHSILTLARIMQGFVDSTQIEFTTGRKGDARFSLSDISKIRHELGFVPSISFQSGLNEVWQWAQRSS